MKFRHYGSTNLDEVIAQVEHDIKAENMPEEEAALLRRIIKVAFGCVHDCKKTLIESGLPHTLRVDAEISIIQSLLGTNIMNTQDMIGTHDLCFHIERFLNVTLNQLGYNATITNRSKH